MIEKALRIALKTHEGQKDKAGKPYIFHPLKLMMAFRKEDEQICAILHDVIEDGDLTLKDIAGQGFQSHIVEALDAITKRREEKYGEYILRVKKNTLATKIKMADLRHNLDMSRIPEIKEKDLRRAEKYSKALSLLTAE